MWLDYARHTKYFRCNLVESAWSDVSTTQYIEVSWRRMTQIHILGSDNQNITQWKTYKKKNKPTLPYTNRIVRDHVQKHHCIFSAITSLENVNKSIARHGIFFGSI